MRESEMEYTEKQVNFLKAAIEIIKSNGLIVIEVPDLESLIKKVGFDTIYHEHLSYISVKPMVKFFERHGWALFDIEEKTIHGGSLRCFVCRKGSYKITSKIDKYLDIEKKEQIYLLILEMFLHPLQELLNL